MDGHFKIDDYTYRESELPTTALDIFKLLKFTTNTLENLKNKRAVLLRSKNSYIEDLKIEIVEKKSGLNLASFFDED